MQYLLSVIHDSGKRATKEEAAAIDAFNDRLEAEGRRVFVGGLGAPRVADNRDGRSVVTEGPYAETQEFVVGLWIVKAADDDAALALAADASRACRRKIEVRRFM